MRLEGIAASPGIGVGPIVRYEPEPLVPRDQTIEPGKVEAEIARFHVAVDASRRDLQTIRDGIAAELGEKEAAIYEAHLMMLDDPDLNREIEETIRRERKPVSSACARTCRAWRRASSMSRTNTCANAAPTCSTSNVACSATCWAAARACSRRSPSRR